jgi:hypothetical protein
MKQCPRCRQTYSDDQLNFCLDDGELLTAFAQEPPGRRYADDSPPTVLLDQSRVTNPTNWPSAQPPAQWQAQPFQPQQFASPVRTRSRDQTIPTIALILGILSLPMCWCGWMGLPAAILGYLGMRNADNDPANYGGRGMAIAGLVMGIISLLVFVLFILISIASR